MFEGVSLGDVPAWLFGIGGLVTAVVALVKSRSARADANRAVERAERATVAAEQSAIASRRSADAAHELITLEVGVHWSISWQAGDTFRLRNEGRASAHGVRVAAAGVGMPPAAQPEVPGLSSVTFLAARDAETVDDNVYVTWRDSAGGDERAWHSSLPVRP